MNMTPNVWSHGHYRAITSPLLKIADNNFNVYILFHRATKRKYTHHNKSFVSFDIFQAISNMSNAAWKQVERYKYLVRTLY